MATVYENGKRAFLAGYGREANPVAYIDVNGMWQGAQRDEWFRGWDDAAEAA